MRPEALAALAGVDLILHAGDVGKPEVLEELAAIAPVTAIRGNVDVGPWADALPETLTLELGGRRILLVHDGRTVSGQGVDVVVCGHSHQPRVETLNGVWWLNPGSAGPRRFRLPVAVARLTLGARISARIVALDV